MIRTTSLHDACHAFFVRCPLAVSDLNDAGTVRSLILMVQDGDDPGFFVLAHSDVTDSFSLWPWPAGDIVDIEDDSRGAAPDMAVRAVTSGVPIPRDGSVLGWKGGGGVNALIVVYSSFTLASAAPNWAVMPLASTPEAQWPPFAGEDLFGHWSWDQYEAGSIVSLAGLVAETTDTVFWAYTEAILGSNCCVVARDLTSPEGYTLPQGCYVYYQALLARKPVPSLSVLLASADRIDLAPRLLPLVRSETGHQAR